MILNFHRQAKALVAEGCPLSLIRRIKELDEVIHARELPFSDGEGFGDLEKRLEEHLALVGRERLAHEDEDGASAASEGTA